MAVHVPLKRPVQTAPGGDPFPRTSPAGSARARSFLADGFIGEEVMNEELPASARFLGAGDMTGPALSAASFCIAVWKDGC